MYTVGYLRTFLKNIFNGHTSQTFLPNFCSGSRQKMQRFGRNYKKNNVTCKFNFKEIFHFKFFLQT